ncbi:hypothetical protein T261_8082 [Streptomyces lydicus]|nr:hypothetical protein T261_8082 [Streptomyces lydicus]
MKAHIGDQLVVESPTTGATRRDGEIIGLHHEDGSPPYDVRWSDTNHVSLVFPGPDAHIRHLEHPTGTTTPGPARTKTGRRRAGSA